MEKLRWLLVTLALPLLYIAAVYLGTRPPKPVYTFAAPTTMQVVEKAGQAVLHSPVAVYPREALRRRVEGSVTVQVGVADDGTVAEAVAIAGPAALRQAAVANVRQWQFAAGSQQTNVDVVFSLSSATLSVEAPEPVLRMPPRTGGEGRGSVRVVALVNPEGGVDAAHAVTGPQALMPAAEDSVRRWTFRPGLRNGKAEAATAVVDVRFGL